MMFYVSKCDGKSRKCSCSYSRINDALVFNRSSESVPCHHFHLPKKNINEFGNTPVIFEVKSTAHG